MLEQVYLNENMAARMAAIKSRKDKKKILLHEIYSSIQGESTHAGRPCIFVRTTGCHLRCTYCDTAHAFHQGQLKSIDEIVDKVKSLAINLVEITGGEPLLQGPVFDLMDRLIDEKLEVLLETSGSVSVEKVNKKVKIILDVKTPSSGESKKNLLKNISFLQPHCEVKFVISNRDDYEFAKIICENEYLCEKFVVLFSPVVELLSPQTLVDWIMHDKLRVRFQLQLHRVLWGEASGK